MPRNAFYAQSGGVTAVINATAAGVIETARSHPDRIGKVLAGRNGIIGALTEDLIDTSRESAESIAALKHTPSGAFGSCRYKLKGLDENRAEYERLIDVFRAHDIGYFFYNGGGDSSDTAFKVSQLGDSLGYPVIAVGIPKTVDNDLPITDNCPGFGSVAKYVAVSHPRGVVRTWPRWPSRRRRSSSSRSWAVTRGGSRPPAAWPRSARAILRRSSCSPKCRSTRTRSSRR